MNSNRFLFLFLGCASCSHLPHDSRGHVSTCACDTTDDTAAYSYVRGALLGSRFKSLEELKAVIEIEYLTDSSGSNSSHYKIPAVRLTHCSDGHKVINILESGISQREIGKAQSGDFWDRLHVLMKSPYVIRNRGELSKVYILARRRTDLFGEGDPAFFDLAGTIVKNINTPDLAFIDARDSTDKGYQNSFDHITAQAFVTSCFSERLADFVGEVHERDRPELMTGRFSEKEARDLGEGPVDNYVDLINNKWGQALGRILKKKYKITQRTHWTPELLANYLNDLQSYYSWAFQIGFMPVSAKDEVVKRFSNKLNLVMLGMVPLGKTLN